MAQDLISGGNFFVFFSVVAYLLSCVLPLWWFSTTELEGRMCSCGTGLWVSNYTWGQDLTQVNLLERLQCNSSTELIVQGCGAHWSGIAETKTRGTTGGVFSLLAVICASCSLGFGVLVVHKQTGTVMNVRSFRKGLIWAALASGIAVFCELGTIFVFLSSPLFDNLDENFGCKFVFNHALNSNPLKCHALGPSFGLAVGGCILSMFACVTFYLAFKNPYFMDPKTGRYSMMQEKLLGMRPLDAVTAHSIDNYRYSEVSYEGEEGTNLEMLLLNGKPALQSVWDSIVQTFRLYHVPVLLLMNAGLFVWSNCSTGATVEPTISIGLPTGLHWIGYRFFPHQVGKDGVIHLKDDVFNFTLITSLKHFWKGEAYALAILIGGFSGCWPYIKLFTMMILWFVPATEKLRGKLLHWLDVLGKWSLVDAYVLCLMAVAFGFNTDRDIMGIKIHVDIAVRPGWGVYSFVIATMWALCMSHYLTYIHRNAIESRELSPHLLKGMESPPHESLACRTYAPFPKRRRFACTKVGQIAVWFFLLSTLAITLLGQLLRTFEFRFSGLADLILPPEKRNTAYSLVSLGALLPAACEKGGFLSGGYWAWFMTTMFFTFAMIVPLLMLLVLAILWGVPMTLQYTIKVFRFAQLIQAWAALDVFLVSIIAAVLEIGGLSAQVLGDAFGDIQASMCTFLKALPPTLLDDILKIVGLPAVTGELEHCMLFRVDAVLMEGCWMMLAGVAVWAFSTHLIMEFTDASINERLMVLRVLSESEIEDDSDPYVLLRMNAEGSESEDSSMSDASTLADSRQDKYLKRILLAQEQGAMRFMGTYFGDCMYGPFPRQWWLIFAKSGLLYKVNWFDVQLGFDIQVALYIKLLQSRRSQAAISNTDEINEEHHTNWHPISPAQ